MAKGDPVQVSPSSLIQVGRDNPGYKSLASSDLRSLQAGAIGHSSLDPTARLKKDTEIFSMTETQKTIARKMVLEYARGQQVQDKRRRQKGIIIQVSVGHTKKTKTPVHKLADRHGTEWLAKESDLELL